MLMLKFLIMAIAALVDKIFQSEFHAGSSDHSRASLQKNYYREEQAPEPRGSTAILN